MQSSSETWTIFHCSWDLPFRRSWYNTQEKSSIQSWEYMESGTLSTKNDVLRVNKNLYNILLHQKSILSEISKLLNFWRWIDCLVMVYFMFSRFSSWLWISGAFHSSYKILNIFRFISLKKKSYTFWRRDRTWGILYIVP